MGMLYALTGDAKYAAYANKILLLLTDAYGYGKGSASPDSNGNDHFEAYGFDYSDTAMVLAKMCNGYDLIYSSLSAKDRNQISRKLILPMTQQLVSSKWMLTNHKRWGMVCLYGVFIAGETLHNQALVDIALYGQGGSKDKVTGGFMDCFQPSCMRAGVVWGADKQIDNQMAALCVLTTVAEVMWHHGVNLYNYDNSAIQNAYTTAMDPYKSDLSVLLALPGVEGFQYAYQRYGDQKFQQVVNRLQPEFTVAIGEHLPPPPFAAPAQLPAAETVSDAKTGGVPPIRLEELSKGVDVAQWFQVYTKVDESHYKNYMSNSEIALIAKLGLRHVRLCVSPDFLYNPKNPGLVPEEHIKLLKAAIRRFLQNNLAVIVDMHNTDKQDTEDNPQWVAGYPTFWRVLAAKLENLNPNMVFFEILNEPVFQGREWEWFELQDKCIAAIRKSAPKNTIVVSGPDWGGIDGLQKLTPVADRNVVYSFHFYDPMTFTHQGATWAGPIFPLLKGIPYPSSPTAVEKVLSQITNPEARDWVQQYGAERWNRDKLKTQMDKALVWAHQNDVSLYCGEFGVYALVAPPASRSRWFHDFASVLKASGIGYAVWGWDDSFGFGRHYVNGKPVLDPVPIEALGLNKVN
jgi:aryl-phospho-beta-D-glucosidase BglC (GH1 family)